MFEVFKNWRHFLEGSGKVINTVTDHKNLEYFTTSKKLSCRQARWAEFLAQFNMRVCFRPGRLGSKPDALTHRWDLYTDGDGQEPAATNVRPIFDSEHLTEDPVLARMGTVEEPTAAAGVTMDSEAIDGDIATIGAGDDFARKIRGQIKAANHPEDWTKQDGRLLFPDSLYVPDEGTLRMQIICNHHDHTTAGHFRETKTTELIHHRYHWLGLKCMVKDYVRSCTSCACTKAQRHKPYGLLKQLPIPIHPWESVSMDFIEQLPASDGFTAILVVVDRLTKQSLFIPTFDTIDAPQLARLFLTHIFSKHGIPRHITSNCVAEFVSHFFRSLASLLNMKLHFTSGYHLEGDSQMEHINQVLEQYLCTYTNYQQDDWAPLLPLAEFAYNNATSETTGVLPFFANKGYHPRMTPNLLPLSLSSEPHCYIADLDQLHAQLKTSIAEAQECYQQSADHKWIVPPLFKVRHQAYIKAEFFWTTQPSKKFAEKNLRPFEII